MMWTDLGARARGLACHLLPREALGALDRVADTAALTSVLARAEYGPPERIAGDPAALEEALVARVADDLALLARWAGPRARALAAIFEDEDRRSLRSILRGLAAAAPAAERGAGAIPTPTLPARLLTELAGQPSVADVVALLERRGHPYADALSEASSDSPPDLLALELALARRFAERAAGPARTGGVALTGLVADLVDHDNTAAALLLAERGDDLDPDAWFLPGGERLGRQDYAAAAGADPETARARLARALRDTPLAAPVAAGDLLALDGAALEMQLVRQRRWSRLEPHGPAPVLHFVLARRREVRRLRHAAWRLALGWTGGSA